MKDNIVAGVTDHKCDKYSLLEKALKISLFFETLDHAWEKSGKDKQDFSIVIKSNISMMLRRSDVGTYVDPFLVIHLLRLLIKQGYTRLFVVESQNLYGNWFENRGVVQIAARSGYFGDIDPSTIKDKTSHDIHVLGDGVDALVPIVDLTHDMVEVDMGGKVGRIPLGKTWINADYRVNFAKMKTHFYSYYTLAIKNVYGCLPLQDKVRGYHCKRAVAPWTARLIHKYPVHFSIVDGYLAADGWLGVKMKGIAQKTHTFIAGADILAVDNFGARLMNLKPERSELYRRLAKLTPPKPYTTVGNAVQFKNWKNVLYVMVLFCALIESSANFMDWAGSFATGGYDPCFPHKKKNKGILKRIVFYITMPINALMDLGFFRLRVRRMLFFRRLKKNAARTPMISGSKEILSCLTFFARADICALQKILDNWPKNNSALTKPDFSGHYFIYNSSKTQTLFPARLTTANLAIAEICGHVYKNSLDAKKLSLELTVLLENNTDLFAQDRIYSSCYE